jgi:hypothetical protein
MLFAVCVVQFLAEQQLHAVLDQQGVRGPAAAGVAHALLLQVERGDHEVVVGGGYGEGGHRSPDGGNGGRGDAVSGRVRR